NRLDGWPFGGSSRPIAHNEAHGRVADDGVAARVVVRRPHAGQRQVISYPAEFDLFQFGAKIAGEFCVALIEILCSLANGVALHQPFQSALEDLQLSARPLPHEGVTPGALHMANYSERAALGMSEQPLWQAGNESVRGDSCPLAESLM